MVSGYELTRKKNIDDNKRVLAALGLLNPFKSLPRVQVQTKPFSRQKRPASGHIAGTPRKKQILETDFGSSRSGGIRRSSRLKGECPSTTKELPDDVNDEEDNRPPVRIPASRPNIFGEIEDIEIGRMWETRLECSRDGIHRPTVAGIHGGEGGCYSVAMSGGYEDDVDFGEFFTFTGSGGRDLKGTANKPKNLRTAAQSKDQALERGNLALYRSAENGIPVRVIRGYKLDSPFSPEQGYRYDGMYTVEKAWFTEGLAGFMVWKFALRRVKDQAPPPWTVDETVFDGDSGDKDSGIGSAPPSES